MSDKTGGPAFPVVKTTTNRSDDINVHSVGGMTLRDYAAIKAMQGDWAAQDDASFGAFSDKTPMCILEARAALYYKMADAMLKVRDE